MLPQGNNIIPGGKLQQGLGYPKTDDDDRNFLKKTFTTTMTCSIKQKARAKNRKPTPKMTAVTAKISKNKQKIPQSKGNDVNILFNI